MSVPRERVIATLDMIRKDIENDVNKWEGRMVDGRAIATMFGELSAIVDGLTAIVKLIVTDDITDGGGTGAPDEKGT